MKNILLDSHALLWLLQEPQKLGAVSVQVIEGAEGCYVSLASIWELGIKHANGKLAYSAESLLRACQDAGLQTLPISAAHILKAVSIDSGHNDPFDKMLIAQAGVEGYILLSADRVLLELKQGFIVDARK